VRAPALRHDTRRRTWAIAWLLTIALHALVIVGLQAGPQWASSPPPKAEPEPIQLTFVEPPPPTNEPHGPTYFTELPEDREDLAPERADFLSNVTSRARDRVPGGDQSLPRMSGENDAPSVAMEPGQAEPKPAGTPAPQEARPQPGPGAAATPMTPESAVPGATTPPAPREFGRSGSIFRDEPVSPGTSDIRQGEMDNPEGNAELTGGVSLNTIEWEWAPWVKRFSRKLMRVWIAPPAYSFGVLKEGGWTVVEIEVARSGEMLRMDVLEEHGHPSLSNASTIALRSTAPMEPLPANFPENTLIMRVRLVYPKIRPR
jgi:hypothetical protein